MPSLEPSDAMLLPASESPSGLRQKVFVGGFRSILEGLNQSITIWVVFIFLCYCYSPSLWRECCFKGFDTDGLFLAQIKL